jgi:uncharacterized repeat protein (TIGR03809 family)
MTQRIDVAIRCDIVARWCTLAEQRLEYLAELFETGRWRRFHSERAFLENIQEAKAAVEIWRGLATRENSINASRLDRPGDMRPRKNSPQPAEVPVDLPAFDISVAPEGDPVCSDETHSVPDADVSNLDDMFELVPSLNSIEARYPSLRNAL